MITVAQARPAQRAQFIRKTYMHLAGAVCAFVVLEFLLFKIGIAGTFTNWILGNEFRWLLVLGAFIVIGWLSRGITSQTDSITVQYLGLGIYTVTESLFFAPLLYIAAYFSDPSVIPTAGILTILLFAGLTTVAFTTRSDFSIFDGILKLGGFVALGLIVCSIFFGFTLGLLFSLIMVVFASIAILSDTSKVIHHYSPNQYVAASLELFASVALLFWYLLRILIALSSRR
ncbi:MAG: permease [Moorea sp. SIO3C2]|nr:permease [Moorena sp. SIO3C2]